MDEWLSSIAIGVHKQLNKPEVQPKPLPSYLDWKQFCDEAMQRARESLEK